jgi:hypothetical protein
MVMIRKENHDESLIHLWFLDMLIVLDRLFDTNLFSNGSKDEKYWVSGFECENEQGITYEDVLEVVRVQDLTKRVLDCRWYATDQFSYLIYNIYDHETGVHTTISEFDIFDESIAIQAKLSMS